MKKIQFQIQMLKDLTSWWGTNNICHCKFTMHHQCTLQSNEIGRSYYMYMEKEGLNRSIRFLHNQGLLYLSVYW